MDTYKDIWEKDEDEILDFFHEITEPLNDMKVELEEKIKSSKKVWMSDEDKLDLEVCLDSVKRIFKGMEPSDLEELAGGVIVYEDAVYRINRNGISCATIFIICFSKR